MLFPLGQPIRVPRLLLFLSYTLSSAFFNRTFMWVLSGWFTFLTAVLAVFGFLRR